MNKKIEKILFKDGVLLTEKRIKIICVVVLGVMMGWVLIDVVRAIIRLYS